MCAQHYGKPLTEGLSFAPPKLLPADLDTPEGKALKTRYQQQKAICDKWYKVLFPGSTEYVRWKDVDGSVMSQVVDEMCTLREISFCEVLPLLIFVLVWHTYTSLFSKNTMYDLYCNNY